MKFLSRVSGILIFLSFIFVIFSYFFYSDFKIYGVAFIWLASSFLFFTIKSKKLILILLFFTLLAFLYSYINGFYIDFKKAFSVNLYLLTLLIAVGFLKLIATPKREKNELPRGKNSFLKTYFGVHIFGSIINLSALLLVADKMYKKAKLTPLQMVLLTRSFASDAYWSPFFVAFAAALTYAPNLNTIFIITFGLFLALSAFLITYIELRNEDFSNFYGYPLSFNTLYLPLLLAFFVLLTNHYYKDLQIILLISLFSFLLTITILPIKRGLVESIRILKFHIIDDLPKMKSEISLFLVAGLFGIIAGSVLLGLNFSLPFATFDYKAASIVLFIFIILAFVGIHPIISISILGDFFTNANHTLLAMTFLMAWATTVSTSPISGLNLTMSARYSCNAKEIFKLNIIYAIKMYIVCVIVLFIMSKYLGV
ncbi:tellurium resistance protein TerC [Aliarcobacter trophiarum]|uniref:tellurium resistance protein TerC n=1 Tax=Aliarcobacter trophiarum TaxID=708186 RepID=UPI00100BF942|nr:tellurium resistance protein TerC [Aliarcobacter trophiarum]RXI28423.1 tellurium resistance protein TerC [Aliarcobacter trophiarum]